MKKITRALIVLLSAASVAHADWIIEQKTTTEGQEKKTVTRIKGEQARVDVDGQMSVIAGPEGMVMLMHTQKMLMKMDLATMKSAIEMAAKNLPVAADQPVAKPVATGQKEKVAGWEAEIYTWEGQLGKGRFWVAKDFAKYEEINAMNDKLGKAMGNALAGLSPQASDFGGMVVKSEMTMLGKSVSTQLVSAKEQEVDAKEFTIPEGYNEMKMPAIPGGAPK
ncbi:MAG: DUF4412 domain-containing protein [Prosthecobacter sp.]|jgi:hypothetical protein|uniref:DUF4412 domain-containing protein n=1 Tax=Prosthecobacter sp. TaxID=1965333 RepID=UPI001A0E7898|nr:DUF4412 domain-containing protein [Prosthecobacter sp.]MBE2283280.1 DUF4412 domain-containing protein [Prosthecobacter sp.]